MWEYRDMHYMYKKELILTCAVTFGAVAPEPPAGM